MYGNNNNRESQIFNQEVCLFNIFVVTFGFKVKLLYFKFNMFT